ncbi:LytR/AlgR family response regulator transcription factor [Aestuariibaculum sediminum]|uniref:LytTR family transcriptional regulator DNA-binding domain-containing protein n=1 Tax=Aestuariibaculum sediminum TaxID=2770637 RepID=A0A8J6U7R5_9FLAO|nr:LytTR family transcriptional regulator DNA-binding domain-containing protein [Aestuariibaculum sediminum]MBD0832395.1 LytTR family transcriptional regulator DNA-binding domain-containing protein [Aestuariibaculum sediminum]
MFRTIIIDDEPPARIRLKKLLSNFSNAIEIIAEASSGIEAQELIDTLKPDLIFLDIEMPGLTGFQLLENLAHMPMVVFCTAYDQYSLQAFETNSVDYLVKPVRLERLDKTIEKLKRFKGTPNDTHRLLELVKTLTDKKDEKVMTSITVKKDDKLVFIKLEDVTYFESDERYVQVYTSKGKFLTEQSLLKLEEKLPDYFLRVHRGIIINTEYVQEIQKYFNSRYTIKLVNKSTTQITSGRSYLQNIKNWIEN